MPEADDNHAQAVIAAAAQVARSVAARAIMVYEDALPDPDSSKKQLSEAAELLVIRRGLEISVPKNTRRVQYLSVPDFPLTRMDQIKMASLLAFSQRLLDAGDTFVALSGVTQSPLDTMMVMRVGSEYELFQSVGQPKLTEHVRRVVFQRVLTIALELAHEGREGRPVGALFVIGSARALAGFTVQNIINPFKGYPEKERNILDDRMRNTVKEFAAIDGAFVIKGNGVILSAGTTLRPTAGGQDMPQGLGARHTAAAAITASTNCIALTVSESDGTLRLWRRGRMITELEKAKRSAGPSPATDANA